MVKSSLKWKKRKSKVNKKKMKANKTKNKLKVSDSKTYRLKNEERTKNGRKPSRICSRKHLGSVTEAPRLGFSSQKQFFSPKQLKCTTKGVRDPLAASLRLFIGKGGGGCRPARPGELGCFLHKQPRFQNVLEGPNLKI